MTMKNFLKRSSLVVLILMGGCASWLGSDKNEYQTAAKQAPLEVPPGLSTPNTDDRYVVPEVKGGAVSAADFGKDKPPGKIALPATGAAANSVLPALNDVRVERAGSQRWLAVKGTPEQLWPALQDFWKSAGYELSLQQADIGVMETDWKENRAKIKQDIVRNTIGKLLDGLWSSSERDKFRTRIERGSEADTTEIYISHRGLEEVYTSEAKDRVVWQPRATDVEMEAEILNRLALKLGAAQAPVATANAATGTANAVAAAAKKSDRASLNVGAEGSNLSVNENFERAWRRVGLALDRVGFTVEDRDRSKGIYFVRYDDPQAVKKDDKGLLASLAFWRSDDKKSKATPYRIHLKSAAAADTQVFVENGDGAAEKSPTVDRILNLLLAELK